jgi:hypothetical protein
MQGDQTAAYVGLAPPAKNLILCHEEKPNATAGWQFVESNSRPILAGGVAAAFAATANA